MLSLSQAADPSRLVDVHSGYSMGDPTQVAGANALGDVHDLHDYPDPLDPKPTPTQYAMIGEFGAIGLFVEGKEWVPKGCDIGSAPTVTSQDAMVARYAQMLERVISVLADVSCAIYTQITDVEVECDGFLNYDRSTKLDDAHVAHISRLNKETRAAAEANVNAAAHAAL